MMRLSIREQERNDILDKYNESTDDRVFVYLRRNFPVWEKEFEGFGKHKYIKIDDKSYILQGNKRYLTNKLKSILEINFPNIQEPIIIRSIRKFLSLVLVN